jgi:hypothetical protein
MLFVLNGTACDVLSFDYLSPPLLLATGNKQAKILNQKIQITYCDQC